MFPAGFWPVAGTTDTTIATERADGYLLVSAVETGIYRTPAGVEYEGVKAKRGTINKSDYAGATFSVSNSDVPWNVWRSTLSGQTIEVNGAMYLQGVWWIVIGIAGLRSDGTQTRAICRRARS